MQLKYWFHRGALSKGGFTLTEIAIVLSIIGILAAGIWTAATNVSNQKKATQNTADMVSIIQHVRSIYSSVATTSVADGTNETTSFVNSNMLPADMTISSPPITAWGFGTAATITSQSKITSAANTGDAFEIELVSIPSSACVQAMMALAGTSRDTGLFYVNASTSAQGATTLVGRLGTLGIPITASDATTACSAAKRMNVQFAFALQG